MIPLSVPSLNGNEIKYVTKAIEEGWVSTAGKYITEFEMRMAQYLHIQEAVACQSGTAGLHLAMKACGIEKDTEVIVPTLTFIAAVNPVKYLSAEPIFMDCDESLTIDPVKLEKYCREECLLKENNLVNKKSGKIIKAVLVVHVFGNMADMERICQVAKKYKVKVIEDATEALGTYYKSGIYKGKFAGTIGDIGVYSFNGNKIMTTGGGGMIVSNNLEYLRYCRHLSTQAKTDLLYFEHDEIGYNYRMTNLQAALGIAQLEQLETFISIKEENYYYYQKCGIDLLTFRSDIRSNYWFYSYITSERDKMLNFLIRKEIQVRPIWKLIHTLNPYQKNEIYQIIRAIEFYESIINIPCSSNLKKKEIDLVVKQIKDFK